jgi:hypothetical protein
MMRTFFIVLLINCFSCNNKPASQQESIKDSAQILNELETAVFDKSYDSLGSLKSEISFGLATDDLKSFPDGRYPWVRIDSPEIDLPTLIDKDEIVVHETKAFLLIDYPVSVPYKVDITSPNGFSRKQLVNEISRAYYKMYAEEEQTATIKTIPIAQRKNLSNRNRTNGKYGIWGHDIGDLALTDILVYKSSNGEIILVLEIDS